MVSPVRWTAPPGKPRRGFPGVSGPTPDFTSERTEKTVSAYARGRHLYLEAQPVTACANATERLGWLDAQHQIREDALEQDLELDNDPSEQDDGVTP